MPSKGKQPFNWYGGKMNWLGFIIPRLPPRKRYVEPFGGSASVLLNKPAAPIEAWNDLDSMLFTFFKVLRERPEELIDQIEKTPYHERECSLAANTDPDADLGEVELARRFFASANMCYNSAPDVTTFSYSTSQSRRGMAQHTSRYQGKIDQLEAIADRLLDVQIFNRDAVEFLETWNKPDTTAYLDPPYPPATRSRDAYRHEMDRAEHERLVDFIRDFEGCAAISTYRCDLYDSLLLAGWNRHERTKETAASNADQERTEALYVNYDIPDGGFDHTRGQHSESLENYT